MHCDAFGFLCLVPGSLYAVLLDKQLTAWDEARVVANIIATAVDVRPVNIRRTNERPVYHAACKMSIDPKNYRTHS